MTSYLSSFLTVASSIAPMTVAEILKDSLPSNIPLDLVQEHLGRLIPLELAEACINRGISPELLQEQLAKPIPAALVQKYLGNKVPADRDLTMTEITTLTNESEFVVVEPDETQEPEAQMLTVSSRDEAIAACQLFLYRFPS